MHQRKRRVLTFHPPTTHAAPYALFAPTAGAATTATTAAATPGRVDRPARWFRDNLDNDTTYGAGTGLTLGGTTFSLDERTQMPAIGGWVATPGHPCHPIPRHTDNLPLELRVNGQRALRLDPVTNPPASLPVTMATPLQSESTW